MADPQPTVVTTNPFDLHWLASDFQAVENSVQTDLGALGAFVRQPLSHTVGVPVPIIGALPAWVAVGAVYLAAKYFGGRKHRRIRVPRFGLGGGE